MLFYSLIICLLLGIFTFTRKQFISESRGSTLSTTDIHTEKKVSPTSNPEPTQPSLVAPSNIQVNVYINNTSPIYQEIYNEILNNLPTYIPTQSPPSQESKSPTPTPTIAVTASPTMTPTPTPIPLLSSFNATYFNNMTLSGAPVFTRTDNRINFEWKTGSPDESIKPDGFSARWEGTLHPEDGAYQITIRHDDAMRIYINNTLVYNQWSNQSAVWRNTNLNLTKGTFPIKIEYYENTGDATAYFDIRKL